MGKYPRGAQIKYVQFILYLDPDVKIDWWSLKVNTSQKIFSRNSIAQKGIEIFWRISALASKMGQIEKKITHIIM